MTKGMMKALTSKRPPPPDLDKSCDLLLRFFQSQFFNEWIAIQYLYTSTQPGVHDYLCNKLFDLSETQLDSYLLQLIYLAVSKPGGSLERTIVELSSRSFKIALKVYWLVLALVQDSAVGDRSRLRQLEGLKEQVERAALEGKYDVPFRNPCLDPLSPLMSPGTSGMLSPTHQPPGASHEVPPSPAVLLVGMIQGAAAATARHPAGGSGTAIPGPGLKIDLGCLLEQPHGLAVRSVSPSDHAAAAAATTAAVGLTSNVVKPPPMKPIAPPGAAGSSRPSPVSAASSPFLQPVFQQLHGSPVRYSASGARSLRASMEGQHPQASGHYHRIRQQLGNGEGVTGLLERSRAGPSGMVIATEDDYVAGGSGCGGGCGDDGGCLSDDEGPLSGGLMSPTARLRRDTFGATLDFIEALCDASSSLTNISQEERQRALRNGLECINYEIEAAARKNVAIWFPMGAQNERVLRVAAKEAVLLNSRDKAPFMLFVEVLRTEDSPSGQAHAHQPHHTCSTPAQGSSPPPGLAARQGQPAANPAANPAAVEFQCSASVEPSDGPESEPTPDRAGSDLERRVAVLLSSISQGVSNAFGSMEPRPSTPPRAPQPQPPSESSAQLSARTPAADDAGLAAAGSAAAATVAAAPAFPAGPMIIPQRRPSTMDLTVLSRERSLTQQQQQGTPAAAALPGGACTSDASVSAALLPLPTARLVVEAAADPELLMEAAAKGRAAAPGQGPLLGLPPVPVAGNSEGGSSPWTDGAAGQPGLASSGSGVGGTSPWSGVTASQAHKPGLASSGSGVGGGSPCSGLTANEAHKPGLASSGSASESSFSVARTFCFTSAGDVAGRRGTTSPVSEGEEPLASVTVTAPIPIPGKPPRPSLPVGQRPPLDPLAAGAPDTAPSAGSLGITSSEAALLDELIGSGCLSPPATGTPSSELQRRMAHALASLRGEAPILRLHLTVLHDPAASAASAGAPPTPGTSLAAPVPDLASALSLPAVPPTALKAMLSKFGLCAKPPDVAVNDKPAAAGPGSGASSTGDRRWVGVRFEIAGGVDLRIISPHRTHRRTPSVEAISAIANKYKVKTIPPAVESGPPIAPSTYINEEDEAGHEQAGHRVGDVDALRAFPEQGHGQRLQEGQGDRQGTGPGGTSPRERMLQWEQQEGTAALPRSRLPPSLQQQQQQQEQQQHTQVQVQGAAPLAAAGDCSRRSHPAAPSQQPQLDPATERRRREAMAVFGERWAQRVKRVQRESPQGRRPGWALRCVIVKNGDDCRQEHLALQLIRTFKEIFTECALPLWLRHYDVLVTSNRTALIELLPDTLSIHTIKHRSPPGSTFSDHFFAKFVRGTPACVAAQRRLTESLAAYSIVTYLLQIKDRHNGNVLVDDEGHLIHIDFGFMLSNSPGGVNFESAPFKLTRELLEVMDSNSEGRPSELFDYFKVLLIQGFLACRKHSERIVLMVKMMSKSGLPCFKSGGERTVKALEKRLALNLTEVQIVQMVLSLISDSLDAWRTRQYDYYQRVMNGIL